MYRYIERYTLYIYIYALLAPPRPLRTRRRQLAHLDLVRVREHLSRVNRRGCLDPLPQAHKHVCIYIYIYIHTHYIYIYTYTYIYIERENDICIEREIDR